MKKNSTREKIYIDEQLNHMGFAIVKVIDETYVVPGWHPVPTGTTRDDVVFPDNILIEKKKAVAEVSAGAEREVHAKVTSSNGKTQYDVAYRNGIWSCTCPASTFRRGNCKHIKETITNNHI